MDRCQSCGAGPDWADQRQAAEIETFLCIALCLSVERLTLTELLEQNHSQKFGPAHPRGVEWKGAGGLLIFSQARHVNFSRMVWINVHCWGMTSSVSVMSSPILTMRSEPQQDQRPRKQANVARS